MEPYIVSARKYRPLQFSDVVGQQSLTTTLKNSIIEGKLAHAYLFCGPRGVGKTTCARIFAKTINCSCRTAEGDACGKCESCRSFDENRSLNIHEIDAASNNSVEDIRQIIEQVHIPPQIGRYKVFIIDEVHMLSAAAFNAFLKTLEEPPAHAVFILATTEKQKILPTILSRCQIYDFARMNIPDIVSHLKMVATKEGYQYDEPALNIIAQKADGGMRDALSILDQVANFTKGNICYEDVIKNLNVLDYNYYFRIVRFLLDGDVKQPLLLFNDILGKGFDGAHFINGLAWHLRNLMMSKDPVTLPLLEVGEETKGQYATQSAECPLPFLYKALALCNSAALQYKNSGNKRLLVEITLIQLLQLTDNGPEKSERNAQQEIKPVFSAPQKETVQEVKTVQNTPVSHTKIHSHETERPRNATVKKDLSLPSFKQILNKEGESPTTSPDAQDGTTGGPMAQAAENNGEALLSDPKAVELEWVKCANNLPKEQAAIAGRMKNIKPEHIKDNTYKVIVENNLVQGYFLPLLPGIQQEISSALHCPVTLQIVIDDEASSSSVEEVRRIQETFEKGPVFSALREGLGLIQEP